MATSAARLWVCLAVLTLSLSTGTDGWAQQGGAAGKSGAEAPAKPGLLRVTPEMIKAGDQWLSDTDNIGHLALHFGGLPSETLAVTRKLGRMKKLRTLSIILERPWVEQDLVFLDALPPVQELVLREETESPQVRPSTKLSDDKLALFVSKLKIPRLFLAFPLSVTGSPKTLRVLSKKPDLKTLGLMIREASDEELGKVVGFSGLTRLEIDVTDGSAVTDKGLKWIGAITGLEHLHMRGMPGVNCTFMTQRKTSLTNFIAINVGVTDETVRSGWIAQAEVLHLDRTKVTSAGLAGVMPLANLRLLRLWGTPCDAALCKGLSRSQKMQDVYLDGLTDAGLEMLTSGQVRMNVHVRNSKLKAQAIEHFKVRWKDMVLSIGGPMD